MRDAFHEHYADFIEERYNCADRIAINAYFRFAQTGAGFIAWWKQLCGSDQDLDDTHLMRMAGRFGRRVHAYAEKTLIPIQHYKAGEDTKHADAERLYPADPNFKGVFLIQVYRASGSRRQVAPRRDDGSLGHVSRDFPHINHYAFHIKDSEWGHITINMVIHPPFDAKIFLNGHEYVAVQARKQGLRFTKEGNCFTNVSNAAALAQIADTLRSPDAIGRLVGVCERWIYSACLCFALSPTERERSRFRYDFSIWQMEYSRNFLFHRGDQMDRIYNGVIDRSRALLDIKALKTVFGYKHRPCWHRKGKGRGKRCPKPLRFELAIEKPVYDLTVLRVLFGIFLIKIYTKGERVLRVEATLNNGYRLPEGHSIEKFPAILDRLNGFIERFLEALQCVDVSFVSDTRLDEFPAPTRMGKTRMGGVDFNKPRMRAVVEALIALSSIPDGFRIFDLVAKYREITGVPPEQYAVRQAAYDLKKLRAKGILRLIPASRRYGCLPEGLREIVALVVLREKVIKPVLAGGGYPQRGRPPKARSPIDVHCQEVQQKMREFLTALGIAA